MGLSAGKLDRKIVLQRATTTRDEYNEEVKTWTEMATRSASYEPIRDGERFRAQQTGAQLSARFQIRWSSAVADLSPKDQLIFEGRTHQILNVKEIGRREGIEITTAAQADA